MLSDGTEIPSSLRDGRAAVHRPRGRAQGRLALDPDEKGYVTVGATYQSEKYDDVYAVGIAAAVAVPWQTAVPVGHTEDRLPYRGAGAHGGARTSPRRSAARRSSTSKRSPTSRRCA